MNAEQAPCIGPVVGILRAPRPQTELRHLFAAAEAGVDALEITLDGAEPYRAIEAAGDVPAVLGAGTVTSVAQVMNARSAGAQFIVSPNVDADVIQATKRAGMLSVPGAMSPTEVLLAHTAGADIVKLFPAGPLGTDFLKAIRGPFGRVPLMATGGIAVTDVVRWLKAGANHVALGSSLFDLASVEATRRAAEGVVRSVRSFHRGGLSLP